MTSRSIVGLFKSTEKVSPNKHSNSPIFPSDLSSIRKSPNDDSLSSLSDDLSNEFLDSRSPLINSSTIDGNKVMLPDGDFIYLSPSFNDELNKRDDLLDKMKNISEFYESIISLSAMKDIMRCKIDRITKYVSPFVCRENLKALYYINGEFEEDRFNDMVYFQHFLIIATNVEIALFYANFDVDSVNDATLTKIAVYDGINFKSSKFNGSIRYSLVDLNELNPYAGFEEKIIYNGYCSFNILCTAFLYNKEKDTVM